MLRYVRYRTDFTLDLMLASKIADTRCQLSLRVQCHTNSEAEYGYHRYHQQRTDDRAGTSTSYEFRVEALGDWCT